MVDLYAIVRRLTGCELITASDTKALTDAVDGLIAELEQVKQERDANHNLAIANGERAKEEHNRAEAAERLAGARVKGVEAAREALGELANVKMDLALDEWCRISNTILSALAEPAGEAEPRQFLPTEDGEFNGNTFGNGDDVPFGWITQRAYDHAYTTSDPVQVTILRTESGPGLMPRVPLYTTTTRRERY